MKKPLLEQVRELAREEANGRSRDAAWVRRAQGELSAEEESALVGDPAEGSEEAFLAAVTRPRPPGADDALLDRALEAAKAKSPSPVAQLPLAPRPALATRAARSRWVAPVLAVAAAAALYVGTRGPGSAPLPPYSVDVQGVDSELRSPSAPRPADSRGSVSPGAHLSIVLRPSVAVAGPVGAAAFVVQGGAARALPVPVRVAALGTVTIEGTREALFGETRGATDVVVWVGPAGALPSTPEAARAPGPDPSRAGPSTKIVVPLSLP